MIEESLLTSPAPERPFILPHKPSILPILFGFLLVVISSAVIGVIYYKNKLTTSPAPSPSAVALASAEPAPSQSSVPSSTPTTTPKPTPTPVSVIKNIPTPVPTPTPFVQPTLDIRFSNPSANIKQTIDEGNGDGRVINREYTSIQTGEFDEVPSSWSPRVTVCYHIVASDEIKGSDVKFKYSLDDKTEVEDNLGQYDKLEAGRTYDWCHDTTSSIGKHTARITLNGDKSLKESNYNNGSARIDWENLPDKIAPNISFGGPYDWGDKGSCLVVYAPSDNVSTVADLKVEQKVDSSDWSPIIDGMYCFKGVSGSSHTYAVHAIDKRGNTNEQKKTFVLY